MSSITTSAVMASARLKVLLESTSGLKLEIEELADLVTPGDFK
jgi:hypothetical protein